MLPHSAQWENYQTCLSPGLYVTDWAGFYRDGARRTVAMRSRYLHRSNVFYGDHPAKILNLYYPQHVSGSPPVVVFVHGGGFTEGHPMYYDFLGEEYLARGAVFASVGYRLRPDARYPDTSADLAQAIGWLYRELDGVADVRHLCVAGHSAGALLTAQLAFRGDWQEGEGVADNVIDAAVLISGRYDWRGDMSGEYVLPAQALEASPVCNMSRMPACAIVAFGPQELTRRAGDPTEVARYSQVLIDAVAARQGNVISVPVAGANHAETSLAFGDPSSNLSQAVAARTSTAVAD